jgi:hypothetical protein
VAVNASAFIFTRGLANLDMRLRRNGGGYRDWRRVKMPRG